MGTPPAEVEFSDARVLRLLESQHPDLAHLGLRRAASGWDNAIYRLGDKLALRLPRRALAAGLIENEQHWLPLLGPRLPLLAPVPLRLGVAWDWFPWRWSILPWLAGETADEALPDRNQGEVLASFLNSLHMPAPQDAPRNPFRGVPLQQRCAKFSAALHDLTARGSHLVTQQHLSLWERALAAPIDDPDTWIHGDLHPRNVLIVDGSLHAVIDWGDMAQGDRAVDLAAIWILLPERESRRRAMASCRAVSLHAWERARGWAVLLAVILLNAYLGEESRMAAIGQSTLERLLEGP